MNFIIKFLHKKDFKRPESSHNTFPLKHEIFDSGFFTQIRPVRVDDLGTGEKTMKFHKLESLFEGVFATNILLSV
jgi:hypothetical protein